MTGEALQRLREIAEKATPGKWYWNGASQLVSRSEGHPDDGLGWSDERVMQIPPTLIIETDSGYYPPRESDAEYIAAIDPPTLLSLLDELVSLREEKQQRPVSEREVMERCAKLVCQFCRTDRIHDENLDHVVAQGNRVSCAALRIWDAMSRLSESPPTGEKK